MHFIFVTEGIIEEDVEELSDKYFEKHQKMIWGPGKALLVDLQGDEPRFESVPVGYKSPEDR